MEGSQGHPEVAGRCLSVSGWSLLWMKKLQEGQDWGPGVKHSPSMTKALSYISSSTTKQTKALGYFKQILKTQIVHQKYELVMWV